LKKFDSIRTLVRSLQTVGLAWLAISCGGQEGNPSSPGVPKVIMELECDPVWRNGEIKAKISERSFVTKSVFDPESRPLYCERYNSRGQIEWREFYQYDAKGNLLETRFYRFRKVLTSRQINVYDSVNNLVEKNTYDEYGNILERESIVYGPDGSKTVHVNKPVNGALIPSSVSVYDARRQNIENRSFSYGNLISTEFNYYDERGQLAQRTQFHRPRNEERTMLFEYDSANYVTKTTTLNSNMMMVSRESTTYDDHWNVWKVFTYGVNGGVKAWSHHAYKYNEHGHWTEDIAYRNGKPVSMRTRIIEYH
jgi:hypothetical protein